LNENRRDLEILMKYGEIYEFCGNIGEYVICINDLKGMDAPEDNIERE